MDTTANTALRLGRSRRSASLLVAAGLLVAAPASASEPSVADGAGSKKEGSSAGAADGATTRKSASGDGDLHEDPVKRYYFLGVRFRDIVLPQFMLEIFAKGGATGNLWLVGPELSMRRAGTEIDISLAYADYGFGPAMFKGNNETDIAYEIVKSDMKVGYLTFDLLFDVPLDKAGMFDFLIGGGLGVGVVAGDLYRVQAYPKDGGAPDPADASKWQKCQFAGDGFGSFCDSVNNHFSPGGKDYSEKSWIDGGQKPVVIPWISLPQLSLRVKPIQQMQARLDVGFSVSGFFFGLAAGYGF